MAKYSLLLYTLELMGSNPDSEIKYHTLIVVFTIFLSYSKQSRSFKLGHNCYLPNFFNSLFTDHPIIQCHIILST